MTSAPRDEANLRGARSIKTSPQLELARSGGVELPKKDASRKACASLTHSIKGAGVVEPEPYGDFCTTDRHLTLGFFFL